MKSYVKEFLFLKSFCLALSVIILVCFIIFQFASPEWVINLAKEDSFFEWLTFLCLFGAAVMYYLSFRKYKNFFLLVLALAMFFGAGEEISWGQRIFNFQTSEYFKEHNSQDEENIHNLVLDGERLNKIIFTNALVACVIMYIVVLPLLYQKNLKFRNFIDKAGVPVPTVQQAIACALVFGSSFLTFDDKGAELLEFGGSAVFMLIVLFPLNKYALYMQRK